MPTGARKTYSFKSVGQTSVEAQEQKDLTVRIQPIGIKTPVRYENSDGLFAMHTDVLANIKDNLRNLLLTNHGERVGMYDFGANLRPLVFDLGNADFDTIAIRQISTALSKYMPYIQPSTFEPFDERSEEKVLAKAGIRIKYSIPRLNVQDQVIEVILWTGG